MMDIFKEGYIRALEERVYKAEARVRELEEALRTISTLPSKVDDSASCVERMEWTARAALRGAR